MVTRWTLYQMETFRIFAATLSMTETAQRTHVSQSAVSQKLKEMELAIGLKLYYRKGNKIRLTAAGEQLLPGIQCVFERLERLERKVADLKSGSVGEISIAAMPPLMSVLLPAAISGMLAKSPGLRFTLESYSAREILERVRSEVADVGFTLSVAEPDGLNLETVMRVPMIAIVRTDHPLAGRAILQQGDLDGHKVIVHSTSTPFGRVLSSQQWSGKGDSPIYVNQSAAAVELAASGVGIALTHPLGLALPLRPDLAMIRLQPAVELSVMMVTSSSHPPSIHLKSFMALVRELAGERIAALNGP